MNSLQVIAADLSVQDKDRTSWYRFAVVMALWDKGSFGSGAQLWYEMVPEPQQALVDRSSNDEENIIFS